MYVYRSNYLARSDHRNRKSVDAILGVIHEYRRDIVRYIFDEYRREYRELTQITHFLYAPPSYPWKMRQIT